MSKLCVSSLYLFLVFTLLLAMLSPLVTPVYAASDLSVGGFYAQALPAWWQADLSLSHKAVILESCRALPAWWPPGRPVAAPRSRPLADSIAYIQIEGPIGTEIVTKTLTADESFTFYAVSYNGFTFTQEVTWELSSDIGDLSASTAESTTLDARTVGSAFLTATLITTPTISTTARITVTPGVAAWLSLSPASETITAGQSLTFTATAYDQHDNKVGQVTVSTTFGIKDAAEGSWTGNEYTAERAGNWTVSGSYTNALSQEVTGTASLTVVPGPLDSIVIEDAAGGSGSEIGAHAMTTDESLAVYAAGYDADGNYTSDVTVTWGTTGGLDGILAGPSTSATFEPSTAGTNGTITANDGASHTDATGNIAVSVGALHHIVIEDMAGGSGSEVGAHAMTTDDSFAVYAAGYDADGNYISDVAVTWGTTGGLDGILAGPSTSATFEPSTAGTNGTITANDGASHTDATGNIAVSVGALHHIVIEDMAGGSGSEVGAHAMTTDDSFAVYAAGYDADGNYISDVAVTWGTTGGLDGILAGPSMSATFEPSTAGTNGTITANDGASHTDATGNIAVSVGALHHIVIEDMAGGSGSEVGAHAMTTDDSFAVYAAGYDADGNYISDVAVTWGTTGGLDGILAGPSTSATFEPSTAGTNGTITANDGASHADATGNIAVSVGALHHILIEDTAGGSGSEIGAHAMTTDESLAVYAAGYDADGNYTSDVTVTWGTTGGLDGILAGPSTSATFEPSTAGTNGTITADDGASHTDATGNITVSVGALHHIVIEDAAGGSGSEVGAHAMTTDDSFAVYAAGYDADGNYISDVAVTWGTTGGLDGILAGPLMSATFEPSTAGTNGTITAIDGASHTDATGNIAVSVGALHHIVIEDTAGGSGSEVGAHAMTTDDSLAVYAAGYDADGNYTSDVAVTWGTTGGLDGILAGPSTSATFEPSTAGTNGTITANDGASHADATGNIAVSVGALHHIVIEDAAGGSGSEVGAHTMIIYVTYTVWAAGYDQDGNYLQDLPVNWSLTDVLAAGEIEPSSGISATFTPAPILSGTGHILAFYIPGSLSDNTGLFTIEAPWLVVSKSDNPDPVPAAGYVQYTIVYTNVGDAAAQNVRITETYDPFLSFVSAGPPPINPPPGDANVWTHATDLEVGDSFVIWVTMRARDSMVPGTVLTNKVTIGGWRLGQSSAIETTVVTSTPDLTLTLTAQPNPIDAGNNLVYHIHYANNGNAPVSGVYITMTYDDNVTFFSSAPSPSGGTDNVWNIGNVSAGGEGDIDITVAVDDFMQDQDILVSSAIVTSDEAGEFSAFEYTTVRAPVLELSQVANPTPAVAFDQLVYTLVYSNVGHSAASALYITDAIPANTDYASCQPAPCSHNAGIVTWQPGGLGVGSSNVITMVVDVHRNLDSGTILTNSARVRVFTTPAYSAASQMTSTVVSLPSLLLSISDGKTSVEAGEELVYVLRYDNTGNGKAYGTTIVATPPSSQHVGGLRCLPAAYCELLGGQVVYDLGTVPGGASRDVSMIVTVRDPLPAGDYDLTALAVISTVTPGEPPSGNTAQDVDDIATRPDVQVQVDYHNYTPYPDRRITYTVRYSNMGHIATTGVVVSATLSEHAIYDPDASSIWQPLSGNQFTFSVGALDYAENGSLSLVMTLPAGTFTTTMSDFDALFEVHDDGGSGADSDPGNNVKLAPLGVPDVIVESVEVNWISLLSHQPGQHVTVTLRNLGSVTACNSIPGPNGPPDYCTGFWIDLYVNPDQRPPSYPSDNYYGEASRSGIRVPPLATKVVTLTFQLPAGKLPPLFLYVRVDNLLLDPERPFGSVPEYDEWNNVFGPVVPGHNLYLPVVMRNY